jgi:hypothetical protein
MSYMFLDFDSIAALLRPPVASSNICAITISLNILGRGGRCEDSFVGLQNC